MHNRREEARKVSWSFKLQGQIPEGGQPPPHTQTSGYNDVHNQTKGPTKQKKQRKKENMTLKTEQRLKGGVDGSPVDWLTLFWRFSYVTKG